MTILFNINTIKPSNYPEILHWHTQLLIDLWIEFCLLYHMYWRQVRWGTSSNDGVACWLYGPVGILEGVCLGFGVVGATKSTKFLVAALGSTQTACRFRVGLSYAVRDELSYFIPCVNVVRVLGIVDQYHLNIPCIVSVDYPCFCLYHIVQHQSASRLYVTVHSWWWA